MAEDPAAQATPVPDGDGVGTLRSRVERRSRTVPPPRRTRPEPPDNPMGEKGLDDSTAGAAPEAGKKPESSAAPAVATQRRARGGQPSRPGTPRRPATGPNEPSANLVVRIRRSVDDRLVELLHAFRQEGLRISKVELVELLVWELPAKPTAELRERLSSFRREAPREAAL